MRTIRVSASRSYDVVIGPGLLRLLGQFAADCTKGNQAALVSDDIVFSLYGNQAVASLEQAGIQVCTYVFPHGERSKTGDNLLCLLNFLAENRLDRSCFLVALGGGVVGDLAGLAAAIYLRGVAYIQVPTTLLAMVDGSVGGKTAIDLPAGKNLAGAFYQPNCVLCDTDVLTTLPENILRDGCAEVIKYSILGNSVLFKQLQNTDLRKNLEPVITACVEMKRDLVSQDEFDLGARQLLNLGHTIGHAVETSSSFLLSHGQSVAIGTAMISRAAAKQGYCSQTSCNAIVALLEQYSLPTTTGQTAEALFAAASGDKKRHGATITLVVPREIGHCQLLQIPVVDLKIWISAGF